MVDPAAGVLTISLHLPAARNLKEKRAVLRPILTISRDRYAVAAAEVGEQDKWQRTTLAFAAVAASYGHVEEVLDAVERFVWSRPGIEVIETRRSFIDCA
jgi:hypothetical protein